VWADYSFSYGDCLQDCPRRVLSAMNNMSDFCALPTEDYGCLMDCASTMNESIAMRCACKFEELFSAFSNSTDLTGETFCCGDSSCRESIVAVVVAEDSSGVLTQELVMGQLLLDCQTSTGYLCSTPAPSVTGREVHFLLNYVFGLKVCVSVG
jgi:hypothetical protein